MKNMLFNLFKKEITYCQIDTIEPFFYTEFTGETRMIKAETLSEQKKSIQKMMEKKHHSPPTRSALLSFR
jgi:hypothetical protein